jgi:beta-lactamase class A
MRVGLYVVLGGIIGIAATAVVVTIAKPALAVCGQYVNPSLSCGQTIAEIQTANTLKYDVNNLITQDQQQNKATDVSVYFKFLQNKGWFTINSTELYFPASLAKLSLLMWFMRQAENDPSVLQEQVTIDFNDLNASEHFQYGSLQPGQTYTVGQLLKPLIVDSDNNAARLLARQLSDEDIQRLITDFDLVAMDNASSTYKIDVTTMAGEFRMLYDASYLTAADSEQALELLTQTKFDKGLRAGVPQNIPIAHKYGEREFNNFNEVEIHDCGIVYAPGDPYVLCVMTDGSDPETLASVIAAISAKVYEEVTQ